MKCPNCGQEIQEEHLYCEKCGMEIQIVPDFEPEIENSITETLITVAEEIDHKKTDKNDTFFSDEQGKSFWLIKMITFLVILLVVVIGTIIMYLNYSVSYQINKAKEKANRNDYEAAVSYLDRALELEKGNVEIVLLQANYYFKLNQEDKAITILQDLLEKNNMQDEEEKSVYYQMIAIYEEQEKYVEINELLKACIYEDIVTEYQKYLAMEPEFSYEPGSYGHVVFLKLSANTAGKIYYTLDGSVPTTSSAIYMSPINLQSGYYQVNAFFVNERYYCRTKY